MRNRGFTLVELLGVIIILSLLLSLVLGAVNNIIKKSKNTIYSVQVNKILTAAYDYTLKNTNMLPEVGETNYMTLLELKSEGLIDISFIDPNTNEQFSDNLVISVAYVNTNIAHDKKTTRLDGNYLYTVEFNKLKSSASNPTLTLEGLVPTSNNNYIKTLDLNESLGTIEYSAGEEGNLTDNVKYYITKDGVLVDSIDSSSSAIYKVNYAVVNDDGYSNLAVLNVIIADTTSPEIKFPSYNKISVEDSSMDLLLGVECTDNSGFCNITYVDTINYGTPGTYVVEYTAQDPSGNTTTQRRAIIVK